MNDYKIELYSKIYGAYTVEFNVYNYDEIIFDEDTIKFLEIENDDIEDIEDATKEVKLYLKGSLTDKDFNTVWDFILEKKEENKEYYLNVWLDGKY